MQKTVLSHSETLAKSQEMMVETMQAEIKKLEDMHNKLDNFKNEALLSISLATSKLIGAVKGARPDQDSKQLDAIKVLA